MEVNHKIINSNINGVALHGPFDDEEEEEDFIQKVGMGRSYDCVFCRRGFTTAQALGGHMNVHRRDRATNNHNPTNTKPSSSCNPTKPSNLHDHASRAYNLSPSHVPRRSKVFFDVLGGRGSEGKMMADDGGRCGMSLGSQGGGDGGGGEIRRASQGVGEKGKEDLDLELRLGYYPYW